jgi:two-component system chemotaxis sensor kinase CheA
MEALLLLRSDRFDLVVSDVDMPRLDGFGLTQRIRADARTATLPVILVTTVDTDESRERGIDAGANAYIVKSRLDQADLLDAVRRLAGAGGP